MKPNALGWTVVLLLSLYSISGGQTVENVKTGRWLNGNAWRMLDEHKKVLYVSAYEEGTGIALLNWMTTATPRPLMKELRKQEDHYALGTAFSTDETVRQLDILYADETNDQIPIAYALLYVYRKYRGTEQEELKAYVFRLRNLAIELSHKPKE